MDRYTGAQVKVWRKHRGMSQAVLADIAGVSQAFISQVESGLKTIERRATLLKLAEALQVPASELVSPREHIGPSYARAHAAIPRLRVALAELQTGGRGEQRRSRDELVAAMDAVDGRILHGDWAGVIPALPEILLDASAIGGDVFARAAEQAVSPPNALGYRDLAWIAADFALRVARETEQLAWVGASAASLVYALPIEVRSSARVAEIVADELQPHAADPDVRQVYGQLQLAVAHREAIAGRPDRAHDRLSEAERDASTLGEPLRAGFALKGFGPSTVNYWRMNVANELGEHGRVPEIAERVDPAVFAGPSLRCFYWMQVGRALVSTGKDDARALTALVCSEREAPQIFQHNSNARDAVVTLVRRARKKSLPRTLTRLAHTVGADTQSL
jgi:transcriptional regulator with XRE-family HTH domain